MGAESNTPRHGQALARVLRAAYRTSLCTAAFAPNFFIASPNLSSRDTSSYQEKVTAAREKESPSGRCLLKKRLPS